MNSAFAVNKTPVIRYLLVSNDIGIAKAQNVEDQSSENLMPIGNLTVYR